MIVPPRVKRQQQAELARAEEARKAPPPPPPPRHVREAYASSGGWMVPVDHATYLFIKEPTSIWYCSQCGDYVDDSKATVHHAGHTGHKFQPKRAWFEIRRPRVKYIKPTHSYDIVWVLPHGAHDPKGGGGTAI